MTVPHQCWGLPGDVGLFKVVTSSRCQDATQQQKVSPVAPHPSLSLPTQTSQPPGGASYVTVLTLLFFLMKIISTFQSKKLKDNVLESS